MTIESILGIGAGVRAAPTPLVAGAGQSFTLRYQEPNKKMGIIEVCSNFAVASTFSIRSPRLHDNVRGIQYPSPNVNVQYCNMSGIYQPAISQDNLQIVGGIGGGAATFDNVLVSVWYEDLVGMQGNLKLYDEIKGRIKNLLTIDVAPPASATGNWGAPVTVNSVNDLFKANTEYAILGGCTDSAAVYVAISGPCTGNVLTGFPVGNILLVDTRTHLVDLSHKLNLPCIPVFHSSDKAATFVFEADQTTTSPNVTLLLAELEG